MIYAADDGLFALVESVPLLSEVVVGLAVGTLFGKLAVLRLERRGKELRAAQVRRIETAWILFFVAAFVMIVLISGLKMNEMPRLVWSILALLVVCVGLSFLGTVIDPEGPVFFVACVVGVVLVSFTDRRRFGWIE